MRQNEKVYSVTVEKKWENTSKEDQVGVGVYLVIGDKKLGPVKLNKENNWTATFTGLTDDPRETEYSVQEILVDGFTTQIDRVVDGNKISFTITNTYWPDEPDKPDGPDEPGKPDVPDEPEFPDTSNPTDDVPNTGDETNLALWLMLMCFSGLAMISTPVLCRPHYKGKHCKSESKR